MIDWLIKKAFIIDGLGHEPLTSDIAIQGDLISEAGGLGDLDARNVIEANGKIAASGFIDMHSHSDVLYLNGSPPLHKIHQGVTTELIGQDGISAAPVTETSKDLLRELIDTYKGTLVLKQHVILFWSSSKFDCVGLYLTSLVSKKEGSTSPILGRYS
jgi:N-acyl-D-amino-acid deacylase